MADLYKRLKAIREREGQGSAVPRPDGPGGAAPSATAGSRAVPPPSPAAPSNPQDWTCPCPLVWRRTSRVELPVPWLEQLGPAAGALVESAIAEDFRFIDTETTGLSGGAGTWIFLAGWSRIVRSPPGGGACHIEVSQFFLEDLGGEADFVAALDAGLERAGKLFSYNGSSFDLPLLRTRWIMNGRQFPDLPHQDCLHPARRFWRALYGGASLGQIERSVLGIERQDDIPGALVPALYLDYLSRGAGPDFASSLGGVFEHHAQDMANLARLWLVLGSVAASPLDPRWLPVWPTGQAPGPAIDASPADPDSRDQPAMAFPLPVHARAIAALLPLETRRDWALAAWRETGHPEWGRLAGRCCKQAARESGGSEGKGQWYGAAADIWQELWQVHQAADALVELLKYHEHQAGAAGKAEAWRLVQEALRHPAARHPTLGPDLAKRAGRLNRDGRYTP